MTPEEKTTCSLCKGSETIWCKVKLEADTFREMPCPACQMPDYRDVTAGFDLAVRQAQREAFEKAAHLASEYTGPGTQNVHPDIPFESMGQNAQHISHLTAQGIAGAIRALMDEESTGKEPSNGR